MVVVDVVVEIAVVVVKEEELAPVQVVITNITEDTKDYAEEILKHCLDRDLRAKIDIRNENEKSVHMKDILMFDDEAKKMIRRRVQQSRRKRTAAKIVQEKEKHKKKDD